MKRTTDIAIVGAGPAGIGAGLAAARNGASVVVIDENAAPGGSLRWTMARQTGFSSELDGKRGFEIAAWSAGALAEAGVDVLTRTIAWGLFESNVLGVLSGDASFDLHASTVIIASGATDIVVPFLGWELPGVLTATAALRSLHLDRVLPGHRIAVLGAGSLGDVVAADLEGCGAIVAARVPTVAGVSLGGSGAVEWIDIHGTRIELDAAVIAFGRQPDPQLALQAQVQLTYSTRDGVFVPTRDTSLMTSLPDIYVAGDAAGAGSPARAFWEGTVAGEAASGGAGVSSAMEHLRGLGNALDTIPDMPDIDDTTLVCRCEEVSAAVIRAAIADGAVSLNDLKRRTRSGMGICQGIYCHRTNAALIAGEAGIDLQTIVPMTARPPARLVSMAALADLDL